MTREARARGPIRCGIGRQRHSPHNREPKSGVLPYESPYSRRLEGALVWVDAHHWQQCTCLPPKSRLFRRLAGVAADALSRVTGAAALGIVAHDRGIRAPSGTVCAHIRYKGTKYTVQDKPMDPGRETDASQD